MQQPWQDSQDSKPFTIDEARRVLADVFAPWVLDLGLSIEPCLNTYLHSAGSMLA